MAEKFRTFKSGKKVQYYIARNVLYTFCGRLIVRCRIATDVEKEVCGACAMRQDRAIAAVLRPLKKAIIVRIK
jgi:hypothetical protein